MLQNVIVKDGETTDTEKRQEIGVSKKDDCRSGRAGRRHHLARTGHQESMMREIIKGDKP